MTRAIAHARRYAAQPAEIARIVIVTSCAAALIAAGQSLPF